MLKVTELELTLEDFSDSGEINLGSYLVQDESMAYCILLWHFSGHKAHNALPASRVFSSMSEESRYTKFHFKTFPHVCHCLEWIYLLECLLFHQGS